jgi:integrase
LLLHPVAAGGSASTSQVADEYIKEQKRAGAWSLKTEFENKAILKLFEQAVENAGFDQVRFPEMRRFKETLLKLPTNFNKHAIFKNASLHEVAEIDHPRTLSRNTLNKYLSRISSLFNWALRHGYTNFNYAQGLALKREMDPSEERSPFSHDELSGLFSSEIYRQRRFQHSYQYWVPLIGLYTGARIEEICQLEISDIRQDSALWVLDINSDNGKKLKNHSSKRIIPIHEKLISLGLVEYAKRLELSGANRLFPELKQQRDGYSQTVSKWFGRYKRKCGISDRRKTFHSFRHTVINCLKQAGIEAEKIRAFVGHKENSTTLGRYGKAYAPESLQTILSALDFEI